VAGSPWRALKSRAYPGFSGRKTAGGLQIFRLIAVTFPATLSNYIDIVVGQGRVCAFKLLGQRRRRVSTEDFLMQKGQ
jgi:hypothetical protein